MSVTSLPLLAAREWKLFAERGLDVEIILMSPALTVPAMISGEIDYFAGSGKREFKWAAVSRCLGFFRPRFLLLGSKSEIQNLTGSQRQKDRRNGKLGRDQSRVVGHRPGKTRHVAKGF